MQINRKQTYFIIWNYASVLSFLWKKLHWRLISWKQTVESSGAKLIHHLRFHGVLFEYPRPKMCARGYLSTLLISFTPYWVSFNFLYNWKKIKISSTLSCSETNVWATDICRSRFLFSHKGCPGHAALDHVFSW